MKRNYPNMAHTHELQHIAAWIHAAEVCGKPQAPVHRSLKERRSFSVQLDVESETLTRAHANFTIRHGFRMEIQPFASSRTIETRTAGFDSLILAKPDRRPWVRARQYRQLLLDWQGTTSHPLTFRSFNLVLAALSFDVKADL